jgi:HK97 family phage portal protein
MKKKTKEMEQRCASQVAFLLNDGDICVPGYTSLDRNPEILTACRRIAELIGSMTIHLMANTENGDVRVVNELSRTIDIDPMPTMTRSTWMQSIIMTMLLYGRGNAIVVPHTHQGYLESLEPIAAGRVQLLPVGTSYRDYQVLIDGVAKKPGNVLHFVYNPDKTYLWKGAGVTISLMDVATNLKQAAATKKAFMGSEYKPSIIVKVDALTDEFASPAGRQKLIDSYIRPQTPGQPWIIPAEQFSVEQVKPLTLADLAISDSVEIDKRTIAAVLGVPPFLLGVGSYDRMAWNSFVQNTIRPLAVAIAQEMTKKLILSPKMYLRFNVRSLMDFDLNSLYAVYGGLSDKGIVTGNEVREIMGMPPHDGLDELRILENYIPVDRIGDQKKLEQGGE